MQVNAALSKRATPAPKKAPAKKPALKKTTAKPAAKKAKKPTPVKKAVRKAIKSKVSPTEALAKWYGPKRKLYLPGGLITASELPSYLDGKLAGDYGFDPLGLGADGAIQQYRVAEVLHARWAMLAVPGIVIPEALGIPGGVWTEKPVANRFSNSGRSTPPSKSVSWAPRKSSAPTVPARPVSSRSRVNSRRRTSRVSTRSTRADRSISSTSPPLRKISPS